MRKISYIRHMKLVGEAHPMHKLTEVQILEIRELYKIGHRNINVIARNYKVSPANINLTLNLDVSQYNLSCTFIWPFNHVFPRFVCNYFFNVCR